MNAALGNIEPSASQSVATLVAGLGLPTSLRDVGIEKSRLPEIAERAVKHPVVRKNPRKIERVENVMEILELAW